MDIIKQIEQAQMKTDVPDFRPGDTVHIEVKVVEGNRERLQAYEGVVIKRVGQGLTETFTVRRTAYGVTTERIFPIVVRVHRFHPFRSPLFFGRLRLYYNA